MAGPGWRTADTHRPLMHEPCHEEPGPQPDSRPPALEFEPVYREYFAFSWRALRALGLPAHALDDAAQEVWVAAHRRLPDFERRSELKTWLFSIALNVSRNYRRSQRRRPPMDALPQELPSAQGDPERECEGREAWELVNEFLATLDETRREVFVASLLEGLSAPETAVLTGLNEATVYHRVRALRRSFKTWAARRRSDV
jgi:RNA polymerase sigma-70 factor, ECF subfamily